MVLKYAIALIIYGSSLGVNSCSKSINYAYESEDGVDYFFDAKNGVIWDVGSDYGFGYQEVKFGDGVCVVIEQYYLCEIESAEQAKFGVVEIRRIGTEWVDISDGSRHRVHVFESNNNGNVAKTFSLASGDVVAFEIVRSDGSVLFKAKGRSSFYPLRR